MNEYYLHECSIASIQLPATYRVSEPLPRLISKRGKEVIAVDLLVDDFLWQSQKQSFDEPLPPNPDCTLSIVRKGDLDMPYQGYERIVQTHVLATNVQFFYWDLQVEHGIHRAIINIFGHGTFDEGGLIWKKIIDSFRFK